ncbi:hypothetical protein BpHYR1_054180 [Brachionus plicatilis]|uniref:Uncharacterized protein n=1 Tax=Brachionus plicatilis TaxID=10195 RepID=A0A3M7P4J2_BRAPC|nr:hypothetical protein BpHYR1_054180 [Brachionus plicatilis]
MFYYLNTHLKHNKSCLNSGLNAFGGAEVVPVATIYRIFFRLSKLNLLCILCFVSDFNKSLETFGLCKLPDLNLL